MMLIGFDLTVSDWQTVALRLHQPEQQRSGAEPLIGFAENKDADVVLVLVGRLLYRSEIAALADAGVVGLGDPG